MIKLYAVYKKRVIFKDTHELKGKGSKNIYHANSNHKKAGVAIFMSKKKRMNSKPKKVTRTQ